MPDNNIASSNAKTANVMCLYSIRINKDDYGKVYMLFAFEDTDNTNKYIWITTASSSAVSVLNPNQKYKIRFTVDQMLTQNEYKISRVKII